VYPETALQLSAYRSCDWAETTPILERLQDPELRTGAVWLKPDGGYELLPVTTGAEEFRAFLAAKELAGWGKTSDHLIGAPLAIAETGFISAQEEKVP